ncbi:MAG: ammonium transporter, partial [Alphaproteobacteria bacterium]
GIGALVIAIYLGKRDGFLEKPMPPHNRTMVMIGASMLWVGWFGFNGGSAAPGDGGSTRAILVTHLSASAACITWAAWEYRKAGKMSLVGIVTGMVAGLASITPAAGHVGPAGAIIIGGVAGILCQEVIGLVKNRFNIDDSLDVFAVHGVGGLWGTLVLPFLAGGWFGGAGLGGVSIGEQFMVQLVGVAIVGVFTVIATLIIANVCRAIFGMRLDDSSIEEGSDYISHGESAYDLS